MGFLRFLRFFTPGSFGVFKVFRVFKVLGFLVFFKVLGPPRAGAKNNINAFQTQITREETQNAAQFLGLGFRFRFRFLELPEVKNPKQILLGYDESCVPLCMYV